MGSLPKRTIGMAVGIVAFCGYLLWPVTTLNCPRWEVWVVDKNGTPVEGLTVRLDYQNYSAEDHQHEVALTTDDRGYVVFPAQELTAPRWRRWLTTLNSATAGVHGSFGPHARVFASGKGLEGITVQGKYIMDWKGHPSEMQSQIIAEHRK